MVKRKEARIYRSPGPTFLNIDRTGYSVCVHRVSRSEEGRESGDSGLWNKWEVATTNSTKAK